MLSRTHNMSDNTFDMLMQKAKDLCFTEYMIRGLHILKPKERGMFVVKELHSV